MSSRRPVERGGGRGGDDAWTRLLSHPNDKPLVHVRRDIGAYDYDNDDKYTKEPYVLGWCRPGQQKDGGQSKDMSDCYATWQSNVLASLLTRPNGVVNEPNTIVFLSAGQGGLEYDTFKLMMGDPEASKIIKHVVLIDPNPGSVGGEDMYKLANEVVKGFEKNPFGRVSVKYFIGPNAYEQLHTLMGNETVVPPVVPAVIAGINFSFGFADSNTYEQAQVAFNYAKAFNPGLKIVFAYHNLDQGFQNKVQTVDEFLEDRRRNVQLQEEVNRHNRELRKNRDL